MFSIYNDQGRPFRSTLEDLYRVEGITPVKRVKQIGAEGQSETESQSSTQMSSEAVEAYRNVIRAKSKQAIFHAYQIMKRPVLTVVEESSLFDCYDLMEEKGVKQLPVINRENKPIGMLTKENLLKVLLADGEKIRHTDADTIKTIISQPMITADPVSDIRRVAQVMYDHKLNCVPIANDTDLILGIITRTDIVHAVSTYPEITLWA